MIRRLANISAGAKDVAQLAATVQREFDNVYKNIETAALSVSEPLVLNGSQLSIRQASATQDGYLSSSDYVRFSDAVGAVISAGVVSATERSNWNTAYAHSLITAGNPHQVRLSELLDPNADKLFAMGTNHLAMRFTNPSTGGGYDGAFEIDGTGNFTGDLLHIHQSAGNSSSSQDIVHIEVNAVSSSANPLRVSTSAGDALLIPIDRSIALYGPVKIGTNYASTGAIRLASAASIYWRNAANGADAGYLVFDGNDNAVLNLINATKQLYLYGTGINIERSGAVKLTFADTSNASYEINNSGGVLYFKNLTNAAALYQFGKSDSVYNVAIDASGTPYIRVGVTVSTDGNSSVRLENTKQIGWRNAANNGNVGLLVNATDQLYFNASCIQERNAGGGIFHRLLYSASRAAANEVAYQLRLSGNTQSTYEFKHYQTSSTDNDSQLLVLVPDGSNAMSIQRNKDVYAYGNLFVTTQVRAGNSVYLYVDGSNNVSWTYDTNNFYDYAVGKAYYVGTATAAKALVFVAEGSGVASFTSTNFSISTNVGIGDTKNIGSATYASGYFGGGWQMGYDASQGHTLEVDNLVVRNTLRAFIFQKDIVRASNGYLLISDCTEIVYATASFDNPLYIYTKENVFQAGDLIWTKDIDETTGLVVTGMKCTVTAVGGSVTLPNGGKTGYRYTITISSGTGYFKVGAVIVRVGSSVAGRQGSIYFDASTSSYSPFMDVYDGVAAWADFQSTAKVKARVGNLTGITSYTFGPLRGYGVWSQNMYLEGDAHISGTLTAGWSNGIANAFYAGKIVTNLVNESQNLSTTPWTVSLGSATRTANDAVAPDGTTTATKIVVNATPTYLQGTTATLTSSAVYVVSMWVKTTYSGGSIYIKLNQGTSQTLIGSSPNDNTWRRYSVVCTAGSGTAGIEIQTFPGTATYWIWGVQVEATNLNNTPSPYQRTDGTLTDYTTGGMWARRGGFGGSMQNPSVWLTDRGLEFKAGATAASETRFIIGRYMSGYWSEAGIKGFMGLYNENDHAIIRFRSTADNTGEVQISTNPTGHAYLGMYDGVRYALQLGTFRAFDGTTAATTMGMRIYNSSGGVVFRVDNTGTATIAGWDFTTLAITKTFDTDKTMNLNTTTGSESCYFFDPTPASGDVRWIGFGRLYSGTAWTSENGFGLVKYNGSTYDKFIWLSQTSASIAGWTISATALTKGAVMLDSANEKIISGTDSGTNIRTIMGKYDGTNYGIMCWDGTNKYFELSSSSANNQIAGWKIKTSYIADSNDDLRIDPTNGIEFDATSGLLSRTSLSWWSSDFSTKRYAQIGLTASIGVPQWWQFAVDTLYGWSFIGQTGDVFEININNGAIGLGQYSFSEKQVTFSKSNTDSTYPIYATGYNDSTNQICIYTTYKVSASTCVSRSDERMKWDICTIENALERVLKLRGVYFRYRPQFNPQQDRHIGVIAQEVKAVFPELITVEQNGMMSVEYQNMVAPLIEAIKELAAKIERLEKTA